jgi:hypothetical protein
MCCLHAIRMQTVFCVNDGLGLFVNIRLLDFVCEIIWVSSFGRSLGFLKNLFNPRTDSEKKLIYILMVQIC